MIDPIDDLRMAAGEILYRLSDLDDLANLTPRLRKKLVSLASKAQDVMNDIGTLRCELGRLRRPEA